MEFCGNNTGKPSRPRTSCRSLDPSGATKPPIRLAMRPLARGSTSVNIPNGSVTAWASAARREYTKRSDYHVLESINTHTVTPEGWVHEQSSRKVILDDAGQPKEIIVHERGLNSYVRVEKIVFLPQMNIGKSKCRFQHEIRAAWEPILNQTEVTIVTEAGGKLPSRDHRNAQRPVPAGLTR